MAIRDWLRINGNLHLVISASTLIAIVVASLWIGRQLERLDTLRKDTWTVDEQAEWVSGTRAAEWVPANVWSIHSRSIRDREAIAK